MHVDRVLYLSGIASRHRNRDRDSAFPAGLEDYPVSLREAGLRYGESAEAVSLERVGACEVDGEICVRGLERRFYRSQRKNLKARE